MKHGFSKSRRGYTLIELAVAIACGLMAASLLMALVNQQFTFLRMYATQNFLIREAPLISTHMNRLIGQAERFRLHNSVDDALDGTNPVMTNASVLVLNFQQPDGTTQAAMLAFQNLGTGNALYYYLVPASGVLPAPEWAITREASNVSFSVVSGVLGVTLTGPNNEQITYSGVMQQ
jgi:hypothetical protein